VIGIVNLTASDFGFLYNLGTMHSGSALCIDHRNQIEQLFAAFTHHDL